ncbi:MAG: hypothetical protein ABSB76_06875 [Streptosporangiaceae bacterium]
MSRAGSAPISASQASGTGAVRLVDLEDAEVQPGDAGLLQGLPVAGIGAVSMMTGALAARNAVWTLAIGVRTSSRAV